MKLRDWRAAHGKTLKQLADDLGLGGGANPSRRAQRVETGESPVDVPLADKIVAITGGRVTLEDLHMTRREWLAANSEAAA
ncbi:MULTISPECIES: helix-turn-helix transcriptional regulator [unclassified Mesorhizobium]|uniref:helix-turn-helix domain-containing protein n=1 Tax=unclassified Mesorhizobium TaxID=325217 RepID=UPI001FE18816|nr:MULTISPECIES: helix-turn-helix transcriptional regulator [unclassified Mesorhizobium]